METNRTPTYDASDKPTACCPRFKPDGWGEQDLHFQGKLFARAKTRSVAHIPIDMGRVFSRTLKALENAHAQEEDQFIVMSHDLSPWSSEHYFAIKRPVPDVETVRLNGDYRTKVFEGPYRDASKWTAQFQADLASRGQNTGKIYFFYTTCPKCAKVYGRNYVVGIAEIAHTDATAEQAT